MKIKAVIFDMDGLMFDTERLWLDSVIMTNKVYGYNVSEQLVINCMGKRRDMIDEIFKSEYGENFDTAEFRRLNKMFMAEDVKQNGLRKKKGLDELLHYLKGHGYKIGLASSSKKERVEERFSQASVSLKFFDVIVSGDMVENPKPYPDIYLKCCEKLSITPSEAIALEDSESGLCSAIEAGVKAVLIPDLKLPSEETINKIFAKLNSLDEVIKLLKSENAN